MPTNRTFIGSKPMRIFLTVLFGFFLMPVAQAQAPVPGAFSDLMGLTDNTSGRVSSFDRSGGNQDFKSVAPGETIELASLDGAGMIRHLYFSIWGGEHYLRDLVITSYSIHYTKLYDSCTSGLGYFLLAWGIWMRFQDSISGIPLTMFLPRRLRVIKRIPC